jgi:hypothetical protein
MHPGDIATLAVLALLLMLVASHVFRSRRLRRKASPPRHGPAVAGDPPTDRAALIKIGRVAADGARSAMG